MCGVSALAMKTNAPVCLREEALEYPDPRGAKVFGSSATCAPEKAVVANAAAVREWDSNGTVFGYNPSIPGHQAGEFGHNDFYGVVIAAAQVTGKVDGKQALRAIRAGKQLSDSKGSSAAISTEAAVLSMKRAMRGFIGPKDIFRNPEAIFRFFEPTMGATASKDL